MDPPEAEARRQGVKALCQKVKDDLNADIVEKIDVMMALWLDIGIRSDALESRLLKTEKHVLRLLNDMYEGEIEMKERIIQNIQTSTEEAKLLSRKLGLPCELPPEHLPILDREKQIREIIEEFDRIKTMRKKEARKLKAEEAELCRSLGRTVGHLCSGASVLLERDLRELNEHVQSLREEKTRRFCRFSDARKEIVSKLKLLGMLPEKPLERRIVDGDCDFELSDSNMKFLEDYLQELKSLEVQRVREHAALMERAAFFWERLDVPQTEQEKIKRLHNGITAGIIFALKQQLEEYEQMKKERVKEFIDRTKDDLLTWYSKCCIPEMKRSFEADEDDEDLSDRRLEQLEQELGRLKQFHAENKDILMKVERREALWTRFLEFEKRATDPSRLNNRGGRLLLEMRERKRLEIELPRLEEEIKAYISRYTGGSRQGFFDEWARNFLDHLNAQQTAYAEEKDREKQERENRRKDPGTPASHRSIMKRGGPLRTPSSSVSKLSHLYASSATTTPTPSMSGRNATAGKNGPGQQRGGTPMRATAKNIRRRSIKGAAQKGAAVAARRLMLSGAKASPKSKAGTGDVAGPSTMDSFTHYLNRPEQQQLTSSVLDEQQATPQPKTKGAAGDEDVTLQ